MAYAGLFIWMVVIYVLSTEYFSAARTAPFVLEFALDNFPALSGINPRVIEVLTRKLAHWSEYFILAVLCMGAFSSSTIEGTPKRQITWAVILGLICAVMDESYQSFVPSRTASARDVLINSMGFVCGTLSFYTYLAIKRVQETVQSGSPRQ